MGHDLIIASSIDYAALASLAPMCHARMIEATLRPSADTLLALSALPQSSRIRVIYRTDVFLRLVQTTLLSLNFVQADILPCQEQRYNPVRHGEDGVNVLLNFNESPCTAPAFSGETRSSSRKAVRFCALKLYRPRIAGLHRGSYSGIADTKRPGVKDRSRRFVRQGSGDWYYLGRRA
jgi:hypothetical protein